MQKCAIIKEGVNHPFFDLINGDVDDSPCKLTE